MNNLFFTLGLVLMFGLSFISSVLADSNNKDSVIHRTIEIKMTGQDNNGSVVTFDTTIINPTGSKIEMAQMMNRINGEKRRMENDFCHFSQDSTDLEDCLPPLEEMEEPDSLNFFCNQFGTEGNLFETDGSIPMMKGNPFPDNFPSFRGEANVEQGINLNDPDIISYQKTPIGKDKEKIVIIRKKKSSVHSELKDL